MARFIKHVGTHRDTGSKLVVAFRQLPDDPGCCLVVETQTLPDKIHDELLQAVESITAQQELDLFNYLNRSTFYTGKNMLTTLHENGFMKKYLTSQVRMTPTAGVDIMLDELNRQLNAFNKPQDTAPAAQTGPQVSNPEVIDNSALAAQLLGQADYYEKEALRLREEARTLTGETVKRGPGRPRKATTEQSPA